MGRRKGSKNFYRRTHDQETQQNLPYFDEFVLKTYRDKNYVKCIEVIDQILIANPNKDTDHYKILQAASYTMIGENFKASHSILDEVLSSNPLNAFAIYGKGVAFYFEKRLDESLQMFNKAIKINPDDMERASEMKMRIDLKRRKLVILVHKMNEDKDIAMAENLEELAEEIVKVDDIKLEEETLVKLEDEKKETSVKITSTKNLSSVNKKDEIKVLKVFKLTTPDKLFNRGMALYKRGNLKQAVKIFSRAAEIKSGFVEAEEMKANAQEMMELEEVADDCIKQENFERVIHVCNLALNIDANNEIVNVHFKRLLGLAKLHLNKTDESMKENAEYQGFNNLIL